MITILSSHKKDRSLSPDLIKDTPGFVQPLRKEVFQAALQWLFHRLQGKLPDGPKGSACDEHKIYLRLYLMQSYKAMTQDITKCWETWS